MTTVPLVILDRDGVVNRDSPDFIKTPEEWQPLPGALDAIARLTAAGFRVAVASNQSGVGRGLFDVPCLARIHGKMVDAIGEAGGRLDVVEYCTHAPGDGCDCRKPRPGLLQRIAERLQVDLVGVPCIGDSPRDLHAAAAVGARPILVMTGNGPRTLDAGIDEDVEVYADLAEAVDHLVMEREA